LLAGLETADAALGIPARDHAFAQVFLRGLLATLEAGQGCRCFLLELCLLDPAVVLTTHHQ
jgi:hypothetical protein